jgi:hypothetical protein
MTENELVRYVFSGHESFQCRTLWLKKGYEFVKEGRSFNDEDAVVHLGVGKNMVSSIRFWLKAFYILTPDDDITVFGSSLLDDDGWDPYLEDDASLWLLHYHLVKIGYASTYGIIFNEFRRERIEFTREAYVQYIQRRNRLDPNMPFTQNTIEADFDVFRKMYLSTQDESKTIEDSFSGILCDLGLIRTFKKERKERGADGKEKIIKYDCYFIENTERDRLPVEVFLYSVLDNKDYGNSISLLTLDQGSLSPASIFGLSRQGLVEKINEAAENFPSVTFNDHAGIKELQIKIKPDPITFLNQYYAD